MADRLTDLVLGLQRMAENARLRGDDLRYTQQQETYEHIVWLDQQLNMVEKVRAVFLEERRKFIPGVEPNTEPLPRIVTKGPTTASAVAQIKKVENNA
jgi:hypothetical protein